VNFERDTRVRIPHRPDLRGHVRIEMAVPVADGWTLFVEQAPERFVKIDLTLRQAEACIVLSERGVAWC
jgi:hypothetical protein